MWLGGAEEEREPPQANFPLSMEPNVGLDLTTTQETMTWAETKSQTFTSWATQVPLCVV